MSVRRDCRGSAWYLGGVAGSVWPVELVPGVRRRAGDGPDQNIRSASGLAQISASIRIVSPSMALK